MWRAPQIGRLSDFRVFDRGRIAVGHLGEHTVLDLGAQEIDVAGALAFGFVHQLVRALNQVRGEAARDEAAVGDASQPQADDADVDVHGLYGQPAVFERPVVALDRLAEALADRMRLMTLGEVWNEKAELVAAEAGVEILGP